MIKIALAGALGKMGTTVAQAVSRENDIRLVGAVDARNEGEPFFGARIGREISQTAFTERADVLVEFTGPASVHRNVVRGLSEGMHCVVGATGLTDAQREDIRSLAEKAGLAVLVAPNFAVGAILMMKFAVTAARFMKRAEIIEYHHDAKADAPSGTALLTAKMMAAGRAPQPKLSETCSIEGARGGELSGINIHSVRLPGLVAHQEVVLGDLGQTLTIRHDSLSRESFMPGVVLAIREIVKRRGFFYGLENFMDLDGAK